MVDDIYLFFYGSMVNKHSRAHTIKKTTKGIPVVIKHINYKCSYNFSSNRNTNSTRFTVLGLMKSNRQHSIPGILVKVSKKALEHAKKREKNYRVLDISDKSITPHHTSQPINHTLPIYTFIKDSSCSSQPHIHTNYYLDLTISGFLEYGEDFARLFFKHCSALPSHSNTFTKWKRDLKKRIVEYTSVMHYAKDDKLLSTLQSII